MNTNKKIIADKLSADSKLSQQDAIRFINSFISLIKNNTQSKKVKIAGFGSFYKKIP